MKPLQHLISLEKLNLWLATWLTVAVVSLANVVHAQDRHLVQIKTFDQQLQPFRNIDISVNGKDFIAMGNKGVVFVELNADELPPKAIKIKNEQLEAASWNYSKGILEVIVRRKNYQVIHLAVRDSYNTPVANVSVTFNGKKATTATTLNNGQCDMPLPLDEKISMAEQFVVKDYQVVGLDQRENEYFLIVEPMIESLAANDAAAKTDAKNPKYSLDFDFSKLDSIQSLTVFYAVFKKYPPQTLTAAQRRQMDAKFNELVRELDQDRDAAAFISNISDTSIVSEDIQSLVAQARAENQTLELSRADFDDKIKLIQDKLSVGLENLDGGTRTKLLSDITLLERLLIENENRFYKNQTDYRQIINSLKDKFFEFENLENKLSSVEAQRLEEQRLFRQRLFAILSVVILFAALIVMLIIFGHKLRKQKRELAEVNAEIQSINENLETLVLKRTRLLAESNRELDTFLYRASHDLRSPICSIIGLCNIASHISKDESKDLFEKTGQIAIAMDRLLKKLKVISEINNPTNFSRIAMLDFLVEMKSKFYDVIFNNRVKFNIECEEDLVYHTYPILMKAILYNLIENALFYSVLKDKHRAEVRLHVSVNDDMLQLSVYDNGIGVDEAAGKKLFEMFYKGNENSKGNGLGLYIVQKAAQALGGTVRFESDLGHFSNFIVQLPLNTRLMIHEPESEHSHVETLELTE